MPSKGTPGAHHHRRATLTLLALALASTLAIAAVLPVAADAARSKLRATVISPLDRAVISRDFVVLVRVHSPRGRYRIRYQLNGVLLAKRQGRRTRNVLRTVQLTAPTAGTQQLRVVVESRGERIAKTLRLRNVHAIDKLPTPNEAFTLRIFEHFTSPAPLGTMGSFNDPDKVVYTGGTGVNWVTYPQTYLDTYQRRPYRSDRVLSVHDSTLDYFLHTVDDKPAGANPSPLFDDGSQYQTYGRYSARMRVEDTDLSEYYIAWLLWPRSDSDWQLAESDFPECPLPRGRNGVSAYSHYAEGRQQSFYDPSFDIHEWHVYTQDWLPGLRRYYVDGRLIGATTTPIFSGPQRWQLQVETKGFGDNSGHLLVDWVMVYGL